MARRSASRRMFYPASDDNSTLDQPVTPTFSSLTSITISTGPMVSFSAYLLPLAVLCHWVVALPPIVQMHPNLKVGNLASIFDYTDAYPMPNAGNVTSHDPNILEHKNAFYMFKGGVHIPIFKATDMSGPWKQIGTVLDKPSIIPDRENATRPWAPTTVEYKGKFYCFYSVSQAGSRHSGIGVASTDDVEKGSWTDHGTLVLTGEKNEGSPYNVTNAIDPSFVVDHKTGAPYLNYGSYWHNLWQVPLEDDLLSVKGDTTVHVEAAHKTKNEQKNQDKNDKSEKNDNDDSKDKDNKKNGPKKNQHNKRDESGNKQQDNSDDQDKKQTKPVENLHATQLTYMPNAKDKPQEGSWMNFHDGYYYLWFSHGKCCDFENRFPKKGQE